MPVLSSETLAGDLTVSAGALGPQVGLGGHRRSEVQENATKGCRPGAHNTVMGGGTEAQLGPGILRTDQNTPQGEQGWAPAPSETLTQCSGPVWKVCRICV